MAKTSIQIGKPMAQIAYEKNKEKMKTRKIIADDGWVYEEIAQPHKHYHFYTVCSYGKDDFAMKWIKYDSTLVNSLMMKHIRSEYEKQTT